MFALDVCLSPEQAHLFDFKNKTCVVIDVLRASSTISTILNNGAKEVIPVSNIDEAKNYKEKGYIVGAERGGKIVEGFDFGNSPFEYTSKIVEKKRVVLTTSNGTKAIHLAKDSSHIYIGSFLNLDAIINRLIKDNKDCILFCAGWQGHFSLEDSCLAGAIVFGCNTKQNTCSDASSMTTTLYQSYRNDLDKMIQTSAHYRRLASHGVKTDAFYCIKKNHFNNVPFWNGKSLQV
tara:strand:- start:529 stop:1230 length:702 start_codon:yes stop_codon:yes gene_type:complete